MPDEDGQAGQERLVIVDEGRQVRHPGGEMFEREVVENEEAAGDDHDDRTPDKRPVLHLLRVVIGPMRLGWMPSPPETISQLLHKRPRIMPDRQERPEDR